MKPEHYYNPNGEPILDEKIYGGNPTGFVDFNRPRYKWSVNLYDLMNANTWFPSEVNTANEKKHFDLLTDNEQAIYKLTFAQLSFNDSAQEEYLSDFRRLANNRLVKAALSLQIMQEVNHSKSYAVLLDAAGNSDEVFDLYKHDAALNRKNQRIANQFARYIDGNSAEEMLLSAMASVNLEGIYFLLGFSYIYVLGDKVPGARDMIKFIARDEINTHLPLFANIFKTIYKENKIPASIVDKAYEMIQEAVDIELEYGKYLLENYPIMGLTDELMEKTVYNYANDRLNKIGLEPIFEETPQTYLQKLVEKHLKMNDVRSNFFESNVANYAKNSLDLDDF
ncbi:ribonucleotide-diphosphate reductase subunit beta [Nitratifractor salsuginis]|uniref:Ribonucleoside-diphosphate reductase subunit beta n=1 Tax=Nitratifractor salsuginis (strain DSM 16511 / JCM 12458 / E9I37-1) TaxID=749222 RepID=E6WZA3_NITSE|nr:ribonucleotide-diphosphate reductase subunit beta [Nitratifractor salsuginis]ADV46615.1 Ribonucleoside-diphosphate reductase [Nitratifractor salsuginis DSM 16511]